MITVYSKGEIEAIHRSCQLVCEALHMLSTLVKPGVTTKELEQELEMFIRDHHAKPAFKGLKGDAPVPYPACGCYSINEVVVHGMPSERELKEGEIIGIDVGVEMEGFYGDAARTFTVGNVNFNKKRLIQTVEDAFWKGMEVAKPGNHLFDISYKIQKLTEGRGFSVVRALVGHGIGRKLHEDPQIPNYGTAGTGPVLRQGMVLAVEPMINVGTYEVEVLNDGWTIVTADRKLSAHYENTILITDSNGPEILTINSEPV